MCFSLMCSNHRRKNSNTQNYQERKWEVHTYCEDLPFWSLLIKKDTFELKVTDKDNRMQRLGRASVQGKIASEGFLHLG